MDSKDELAKTIKTLFVPLNKSKTSSRCWVINSHCKPALTLTLHLLSLTNKPDCAFSPPVVYHEM